MASSTRMSTSPLLPLERHHERVVEHLVVAHDALALRRRDHAADGRRAVAERAVDGVLEGEAAAQPAAQARDAAGVHRHVLILRHAQRDRLLVRGEARAAALGPAHAAAAALPRGLARAHLAHLDARAEPARERAGDRAQLDALLRAVGQRDARGVEADLGRDRARVLDARARAGGRGTRASPCGRARGSALTRCSSSGVARRSTGRSAGSRGERSTSWFAVTTRAISGPREVPQMTRSSHASSSPLGSKLYTFPPGEKTTFTAQAIAGPFQSPRWRRALMRSPARPGRSSADGGRAPRARGSA